MDYSKRGVVKKQRRIKSNVKRLSSKLRISLFRLMLVGIVFLVITGCFAGVGAVKGMIDNAPDVSQISIDPVGYTSYIYYKDGTLADTLIAATSNREYVTIDKVPLHVQQCFIAKEDERFYEHNGIDVWGIFRAVVSVVETRDLDFGASTITQQVIKNRVFGGGREPNAYDKILRKIQEQYLAIKLENQFSKDRILEAYMNDVNLGYGSFGIQVAAQNYFGKDVGELTLSEAAVIAPIVWSPTLLNPVKYPEENMERRQACLDNMLRLGFCSQEEYDEAMADNVYERLQERADLSSETASVYSYYTDTVINQVKIDLLEKKGYTEAQASELLFRGGIRIYTAQDKEMQAIMDKYYTNEENFPEIGKGSYYELNNNYAISVYEDEETVVHYHFNDLMEYFKDYKDTEGLYYHSNGRRVGISQYTIDKEDLMEKLEEFRNHVVPNGERYNEKLEITLQPQSSMVIIEQATGQVAAIYGGRGGKYVNRVLNRASDSLRQVGSTFKVLASFLPALDTAGMTLATVADDSEYHYPDSKETVRNWNEGVYKGLKSIREGVYNSMNIVACRIFELVTPQVGFSYLKQLGFTSLVENMVTEDGKVYSDIVYPLALGGLTKGVTNVELTAAYATIANGGVYNKPVFYTKVVDRNGKIILSNETPPTQVIKSSTAFLLTSAMQDTVKIGTGTRLAFKEYTMSVAGKTGTSTANNDLWFVGYTPYYTAGVWTGFDNNFDQYANKSYHQNLWRNIMEEVHAIKQLENVAFEKPDSIVTATICTKCGNLAVDGLCKNALGPDGEKTRTEFFAKGTVPTQKCTCHVKVYRCKASNLLKGIYCPQDQVEEVVFLDKKETSKTWDTPFILPTQVCNVHNHAIDDTEDEHSETNESPSVTPQVNNQEEEPEDAQEEEPEEPVE